MWWKATPRYIALGYKPIRQRLPGAKGDGRDLERAEEARRLTRAMVDRFAPDRLAPDTWAWLIRRYRTDRYSPYHELKANTRGGYDWQLDRWARALGDLPLGAMTFERARETQTAMAEKGRSASYIRRMFTTLRIVANYGRALRLPGARAAAEVLAEVRLRSAPKRQVFPTRAEIRAIVDEADARGLFAYATGLLMQWTLSLRGVDVFGQWLADPKGEGGIRKGDLRWDDGLTWAMVEPDLMGFSKVLSKTRGALPEPIRFPLEDAPELRARLRLLGNGGRVGPVITVDGLPYALDRRSKTFLRLKRALGLRDEITMMDTRAGALTDGQERGADLIALRDAAGHLDAATTNRYVRGREASIAKVVKLREGTKG